MNEPGTARQVTKEQAEVALYAAVAFIGALVVADLALSVGLLRHLGVLEFRVGMLEPRNAPGVALGLLGPPLGSARPRPTGSSLNLPAPKSTLLPATCTLVVCISARCASCQKVVALVESLPASAWETLTPLVVMDEEEATARNFIRVFSPTLPVFLATSLDGYRDLQIPVTPFALLYDPNDKLVKKGVIYDSASLEDMISEVHTGAHASEENLRTAFPQGG